MFRPITLIVCMLALLLPVAVSAEDFQEDFNDEFLSDQWEIMNPNEDSMIV